MWRGERYDVGEGRGQAGRVQEGGGGGGAGAATGEGGTMCGLTHTHTKERAPEEDISRARGPR